jgi:hypothetical protein
MSQTLKAAIAVVGIDIGKNSFHVVGLDRRGAMVLRQKWSRGQARALISMMARNTCSNKRPDTLMQDRSPPTRRSSLATHGRTIHPGHFRPIDDVCATSAFAPIATKLLNNSRTKRATSRHRAFDKMARIDFLRRHLERRPVWRQRRSQSVGGTDQGRQHALKRFGLVAAGRCRHQATARDA